MPFEQVIRPFVTSSDPAIAKAGPVTIPAVVPPVILIAGGAGSGKILNGSFSLTITSYVIKQPKERSS